LKTIKDELEGKSLGSRGSVEFWNGFVNHRH